MSEPVYLDHNATTAPSALVLQEMCDALQRAWGNPSSTHGVGQQARRLMADARVRVAQALGCQPVELVFTSGATEANHMAILGALELGTRQGRQRLVIGAVEHPGSLALARRLADSGVPVDVIPVGPEGVVDLQVAEQLITPDVAVVSVMAANNETGVCMPTQALAHLCERAGVLLHVDATQAIGKMDFAFDGSGIDLASVSAHKIHGPKGVGALLVRKGLSIPALLTGRQERGRRGGTENMPGIAGFAAAADELVADRGQARVRVQALRDHLENALGQWPDVQIYGQVAPRVANTLCVRFAELDSDQVLNRLERAGFVAASGAACTASGTQPSHVLKAMGATDAEARAGIRFSLGRETTFDQMEALLQALENTIRPLMPNTTEPVMVRNFADQESI